LTWETDRRIDTGAPANDTVGSYMTMKAFKNNVYICWKDERSGVKQIYYSMSPNYGVAGTWTAPQPVDALNYFYDMEYPVMDFNGLKVYIAWQQTGDVYCNHSLDGGVTWDPNTVARVDTDIPIIGDSLYIEIAAAKPGGGGGVSLPFHGGGGNFTKVRDGVFGGASGHGQIPTQNYVYCFWRDYRNASVPFTLDVYFNWSLDNGVTWGDPDQRLNTHTNPSATWVGEPSVAGAGNTVYAVWLDEKDDANPGSEPYIDDVYVNVSNTHGVAGTWSGPIRMDTGTPAGTVDSWHPSVKASSNHAWVAFNDERDSPVNFYDSAYCTWTSDAGATWTYSERIDSGGNDPGAKYVETYCEGTRLHVAYTDYRYGGPDAFYNGRTF